MQIGLAVGKNYHSKQMCLLAVLTILLRGLRESFHRKVIVHSSLSRMLETQP